METKEWSFTQKTLLASGITRDDLFYIASSSEHWGI